MPSTVIEVRHQYEQREEIQLIEAVQAALVSAFAIPESDRDIRLIVHSPHRFIVSQHRSHPERCVVISIDAFAGRSLDAKRALYRGIVERLEPLGIPRDHVKIVLRDVPRENWGIRGGQAGSDVDIGFKIDV